MPTFVPGLELAESFCAKVIEPRLAGLKHSAALIGTGSEILGYDDFRSTDQGWGPGYTSSSKMLASNRPTPLSRDFPGSDTGWPTQIGSDHYRASAGSARDVTRPSSRICPR